MSENQVGMENRKKLQRIGNDSRWIRFGFFGVKSGTNEI
jgi:hypothetical protein